jgi:hypothetical protein
VKKKTIYDLLVATSWDFYDKICHILDSILLAKSLQSSGKFWTILSKRNGPAFPTEDPCVEWKRSTYTADYYQFGIFMDFDCDSSKEAFNEVNGYIYTLVTVFMPII